MGFRKTLRSMIAHSSSNHGRSSLTLSPAASLVNHRSSASTNAQIQAPYYPRSSDRDTITNSTNDATRQKNVAMHNDQSILDAKSFLSDAYTKDIATNEIEAIVTSPNSVYSQASSDAQQYARKRLCGDLEQPVEEVIKATVDSKVRDISRLGFTAHQVLPDAFFQPRVASPVSCDGINLYSLYYGTTRSEGDNTPYADLTRRARTQFDMGDFPGKRIEGYIAEGMRRFPVELPGSSVEASQEMA